MCASAQHTSLNPDSDHEPNVVVDGVGYATAVDLTDDKAAGCDADWLVEQLRLRQDPRIKYVIAERRMYSSYPARGYPAWTWRPYTGSNPHSKHVHISVLSDWMFSTLDWWPAVDEEETLTDDLKQYLDAFKAEVNQRFTDVQETLAGYKPRSGRKIRSALGRLFDRHKVG